MPDPVIAVSMPRPDRTARWIDELSSHLPEFRILPASEVQDVQEVTYAIVWKPPTGLLAGYPNLKAVVSVGAGIDHVAADAAYPVHVPVIKTIGPDMTLRMQEYVVLHVLRLHRDQPRLDAAQRRGQWDQHSTPTATHRRVGILGMGHLGQAAARSLAAFGVRCGGLVAQRHTSLWDRGFRGCQSGAVPSAQRHPGLPAAAD